MKNERICNSANCNNSLEGKRIDAKFCSNACRTNYKNENRKIKRITAITKIKFPDDLLKELNYRVGRINAGLSDSSDLVMIDTIMQYIKVKLKEKKS